MDIMSNHIESAHVTRVLALVGCSQKLFSPIKLTISEMLSEPFVMHLLLAPQHLISDTSILVNQEMTLQVNVTKDRPRTYSGRVDVVKTFCVEHVISQTVILKSYFSDLKNSNHYRIFQQATPLEIVEKVAQDSGYRLMISAQLNKMYENIPCVVQYNESDFDFLSRLLAQNGIYYYFIHGVNTHTMVLADNMTPRGSLPQTFDSRHSLLTWQPQAKITASSVKFKATNYMTMKDKLLISAKLPSAAQGEGVFPQEQYHHSDQFNSRVFSERLANDQCNNIFSTSYYITATTHCGDLSIGQTGPLNCYYPLAVDDQHLIGGIKQTVIDPTKYGNTNNDHYYQNAITAQIGDVACNADQYLHFYKRNNTLAHVVGSKQSTPDMDKYGRIKLRYVWDEQVYAGQSSTCWVRCSQPIAHNRVGWQCIPYVGEEVFSVYINNDINQFVVLGASPVRICSSDLIKNSQLSGVASKIFNKNVLLDASTVQFNDALGFENIKIHSSHRLNNYIARHDISHINHSQYNRITGDQDMEIQKKLMLITANHFQITVGPNIILGCSKSLDIISPNITCI